MVASFFYFPMTQPNVFLSVKSMSAASAAPAVTIDGMESGMTLDILGVPHGVDRQHQLFNADTDLGDIPVVPLVYFHGFDSKHQRVVQRIGWGVKSTRDSAGQWYKGYLDAQSPMARKIFADAGRGMARASSDAVSHLVRPFGILGKPGTVTSWPVAYLSLMDASTYDLAANMNAVAIPALKAICISDEIVTLSDTGEVAVKAGNVFNSKHRANISMLQGLHSQAVSILDGMVSDFPADPQMAATNALTPSVKASFPIALSRLELTRLIGERVNAESCRRGI